MTASHSSSVMLTSTRSRRMPALLTRMWRSPKASTAELIRRWPPSQSATLSALATASPPIALISSTTCSAGVRSSPVPSMAPPRSFTTTLAPSWANSSACSRPMPRPAPVMMATRPSRAPMVQTPPPRGWFADTRGRARKSLLGVEVDARSAFDLRALGRVGGEDLLVGWAEHDGHPEARRLHGVGRLIDALAGHVGHLHQVGTLGHVDRHGRALVDLAAGRRTGR